MAAGVMALLGFVPGFPTLIFLAIAGLLVGGVLLQRRRLAAAAVDEADAADAVVAQDDTVVLHLGAELAAGLGRTTATALAQDSAEALEGTFGVPFPVARIDTGGALAADGFRIDIDGVPVQAGTARAGKLLLRDDPMHLDLLDLEVETAEGGAPHWIDGRHEAALVEAGIGHAAADQVVGDALAAALRRYAPHFLGIQETQAFLSGSRRRAATWCARRSATCR